MDKRFIGSLPIETEPWRIGVICGRSATGKTTIAKKLFPQEFINGFTYLAPCVLDDFPEDLTVAQITATLCSVGFASPPDWLKPYACLSQGEKMRVDIARALLLKKNRIVFDEFTSVIDRDVARMACIAISKGVRKSTKQLIVVTCHRDVVDWLEPDWVLDTDNMAFGKKKEPDSRLSSKSSELTLTFGECLGSITI